MCSLGTIFKKKKCPCCLCAAQSLISMCNNVCVCVCVCIYESSVASAYSFGLATNPSSKLSIKPDPKVFWNTLGSGNRPLGCMSAAGTGELQFIEGTLNANMYCDILKQSMIPSLRRLGRRAVFQQDNDHCLAKEAEGKGDGLAKHVSRLKPYWASVGHPQMEGGGVGGARSPTSTSSVMLSCRSGRGLQWQPVKLWLTPCPRRLRQCWKIIVAKQNIDTLGPIWTFSLLIPCNTNQSHDTGERKWWIGPNLDIFT